MGWSGGYFLVYEGAKRALTPEGSTDISIGTVLLCGALAGFGMWIPAFPLDVIKSKAQAEPFTGNKYVNACSAVRGVIRLAGAGRRDVGTRLLKGTACCSIWYIMYVLVRVYIYLYPSVCVSGIDTS